MRARTETTVWTKFERGGELRKSKTILRKARLAETNALKAKRISAENEANARQAEANARRTLAEVEDKKREVDDLAKSFEKTKISEKKKVTTTIKLLKHIYNLTISDTWCCSQKQRGLRPREVLGGHRTGLRGLPWSRAVWKSLQSKAHGSIDETPHHPREVAMKIVQLSTDSKTKKYQKKEIEFYIQQVKRGTLDHPNIIGYFAFVEYKTVKEHCVFMELCDTTLRQVI